MNTSINGLVSTTYRLKEKNILKDDVNHLYEIVELHKNYCVVAPFPNSDNFACELMTYDSMLNEGWTVIGEAYQV